MFPLFFPKADLGHRKDVHKSQSALPKILPTLLYVALGLLICLNVWGIYAYQHLVHMDIPYQDEWRYLVRLQQLPDTGFLRYLFDRDGAYYMPIYLLTWYLSYAFTHLDIMALRYAGAVTSGLASLLLCMMLLRKMTRHSIPAFLIIACASFVVCSLNFWDTYGLAISSFVIPIQLGVILLSFWSAEHSLDSKRELTWILVSFAGALFTTGVYPNGLALLPAILIARYLITRRVDRFTIALGVGALILAVVYLIPGTDHYGKTQQFQAQDILLTFKAWLGLSGDALSSPVGTLMECVTLALGLLLSVGQLAALIHILRQPADKRGRYFIPLALVLFNGMVFLEILVERLQYPGFEFYPRYAFLMLCGPISLMFMIVMEYGPPRFDTHLKFGTVILLAVGVFFGDIQSLHVAPYRPSAVNNVRAVMLSLHAEPTPDQARTMFLSSDIVTDVYPGTVFMREKHLSIFRDNVDGATAAQAAAQGGR